jgi:hypothetical protein
VLPTVRIPIAAPANGQQHLRISLLDSSRRLLASWQQPGSPQCGSTAQHTAADDVSEVAAGTGAAAGCLVFQQDVLGSAGGLQAQLASEGAVHLEVQELWAAIPQPGTFFVKVGACVVNTVLCGIQSLGRLWVCILQPLVWPLITS